MNKKVTIKKGTINFEFARTDLIEVKESSDGLVFMLKGGFMVVVTDTDMPTHIKVNIVGALNQFTGSNVVVDMLNYNRPVSINAD